MSFLGIGPLEFVLLAVLALVILGPKEIALVGKKLGRFLYNVKHSDIWLSVQETRQRAKNLGQEIMDDTNLDDFRKELNSFGFQPNTAYQPNPSGNGDVKLPKIVAPPTLTESALNGTTPRKTNKMM